MSINILYIAVIIENLLFLIAALYILLKLFNKVDGMKKKLEHILNLNSSIVENAEKINNDLYLLKKSTNFLNNNIDNIKERLTGERVKNG